MNWRGAGAHEARIERAADSSRASVKIRVVYLAHWARDAKMLLRTTMHPRRLGQSARFHPAMASRLSRGARARATGSNSEPEGRRELQAA